MAGALRASSKGHRSAPPLSAQEANKMIKNFLYDETGLELTEYAVAAALVTLAVVAAFGTLGKNINTVIGNLAGKIQ
jgi:pilus assembly protein Flp/PilA